MQVGMDGESYGGGEQTVAFKLQYGHASTEMVRSVESTIGDLKEEIACLHGIPKEMQKVLFRGLLNEDGRTLKELKLKNGAKMMLVGSSPKDLLSVAAHPALENPKISSWDEHPSDIPLSLQEKHRKVLRKGPPDGSLPGLKGVQCPLPDGEHSIPGLLNALGNKVRLTFKPELRQLWIGSAQATQKVSYNMITRIESYLHVDKEEYSILSLQIGPSSSTRYWLYFIPSQLVSAIKLRIFGNP